MAPKLHKSRQTPKLSQATGRHDKKTVSSKE
jgi:hypothetical protein